MFELASVGLGFSLTEIFILSLGLLYFIDFKTRSKENRLFYIIFGMVSLMVFLAGLVYAGKFAVYNSFLFEEKDKAIKFLTVGIIFGSITFPFALRLSTKLFIRH